MTPTSCNTGGHCYLPATCGHVWPGLGIPSKEDVEETVLAEDLARELMADYLSGVPWSFKIRVYSVMHMWWHFQISVYNHLRQNLPIELANSLVWCVLSGKNVSWRDCWIVWPNHWDHIIRWYVKPFSYQLVYFDVSIHLSWHFFPQTSLSATLY